MSLQTDLEDLVDLYPPSPRADNLILYALYLFADKWVSDHLAKMTGDYSSAVYMETASAIREKGEALWKSRNNASVSK